MQPKTRAAYGETYPEPCEDTSYPAEGPTGSTQTAEEPRLAAIVKPMSKSAGGIKAILLCYTDAG